MDIRGIIVFFGIRLHLWISLMQLILGEVEECFERGWHGRWYHSELGEVTIRHNDVSTKGACRQRQRDQYLIENRSDGCHLCLLMMQRHRNIIQYKESFCLPNVQSLEEICSTIDYDSTLHTLVRENASPVRCPFIGHHTFTYKNNIGGQCGVTASSATMCEGVGHYKFSFASCPGFSDKTITLSKERDFECLASWKDGSETFFYGSFMGSGAEGGGAKREDMYRCFMYESLGADVQFSMSVDASCRGLMSPQAGPLMVTMTTAPHWKDPACIFPEWFRRIRWRDLQGTHYYHSNTLAPHTIDIDYRRHRDGKGHTVTSYRCNKLISMTSKEYIVSSQTIHDCKDKYQCLKLKKRNEQVIEIHLGKHEHEPQTCPDEMFDNSKMITLIPVDMYTTACPFPGYYDVLADRTPAVAPAAAAGSCPVTRLQSGCNDTNVITFDAEPACDQPTPEPLECLSHWEEDNRQYMIARLPAVNTHAPVANCYVFASTGDQLTFSMDPSCNPAKENHAPRLHYQVVSQPEPCLNTGAAGYLGSDLMPMKGSAGRAIASRQTSSLFCAEIVLMLLLLLVTLMLQRR